MNTNLLGWPWKEEKGKSMGKAKKSGKIHWIKYWISITFNTYMKVCDICKDNQCTFKEIQRNQIGIVTIMKKYTQL